MVTPDMYTTADFERGNRLLNACSEVILAHELSMRVPAYSDLTDPFKAYLSSSTVTLETISQLQVDDDTAQNLVRHVLRNILQRQAAMNSTDFVRQASNAYGLLSKEFMYREFAAFPAADGEMMTGTMAVLQAGNPVPVDEAVELPTIAGFIATQNNHRSLRFNTADQPLYIVPHHKHVLNLFKPDTLAEPAVRLAVTETVHHAPDPRVPSAQREHRIGWLRFKL